MQAIKQLSTTGKNTSYKVSAGLNLYALLVVAGVIWLMASGSTFLDYKAIMHMAVAASVATIVISTLTLLIMGDADSRAAMVCISCVVGVFVGITSLFAYYPDFTVMLSVAAALALLLTLSFFTYKVKTKAVQNSNGRMKLKRFKRGGPNDPYRHPDGRWKHGRLRAKSELVRVDYDASVGLHVRYDRLEIPNVDWGDLIGNHDLQVKVRTATLAIHGPWYMRYPDDPLPTNAPNGILLTGDPGNGKTFIAELVAGSFGYPLFTLTKDIVSSQWVGETVKAVSASFDMAMRNAPCVLFIDEIDSFIMERGRSNGAADAELISIVNTFLTKLVEIRKFPIIVMAATNHFDKLDPAAVREGRFDYKITVDNPDEKARIGLLSQSLKKHCPQANFNWPQIEKCAKRFNGFNVKRILAIGERMPDVLRKTGKIDVGHEEVMAALRIIQGTKGRIPENAIPLNELVLPPMTRKHVDNLLNDLKTLSVLEEFGGEMMRGALFYGPAGTGKSSVAKTIAKESGWGFLAVTGPDLAADRELLQKTYERAKNLRPCIIFIDEADAVLRDRTASNYPEVTNKLLTIMQGADDPVKDVVFLAATNHPDMIDPALLRTGRFTGKVEFSSPGPQELEALASIWLGKRKDRVALDRSVNLNALFHSEGLSQANLEGVLQESLNSAIRNRRIINERVFIDSQDLEHAMRLIQA